ncbi:3-hydroxypropanoate dehydrogenase [Micrococcales bacterium KH10]|nr:3-hydroxypropanoate dehydrogenase [Micrococcales bacterium KH10]
MDSFTSATDTLETAQLPDEAIAELSEIDRIFVNARTTRRFAATEVSDEVLARAYDKARWAPTAMNSQPLRLLVVRTPQARERLAAHMSGNNRDNTLAAPVSLVVAADLDFHTNFDRLAPHMTDAVTEWRQKPAQAHEAMAIPSTWLQMAYLILALRSEGLDVGPMTGFKADGINQEFFADNAWRTLAVLNVGYAAADEKVYPRAARLEFNEIARIV